MGWSEIYTIFGIGLIVVIAVYGTWWEFKQQKEDEDEEESPKRVYMTRYREKILEKENKEQLGENCSY